MNRQFYVLMHRYVGLVMAIFLVIIGLTGSVIAFMSELDAFVNPHLMKVERQNAALLSPVLLREKIAKQYSEASINRIPLSIKNDEAVIFSLEVRSKSSETKPAELENDEVFINPYTGEILGVRKWGDVTQGFKNLIPFIYKLHFSLAIGDFGSYVLGIVALLWTLDCFVGAYLTFPSSKVGHINVAKIQRKSWLKRWQPAWFVRYKASAYKINYDLHRAGGLWVWAMLFVFAWSSVGFNLQQVYNPVMRGLFNSAYADDDEKKPAPTERPNLNWQQALNKSRLLMQQAAKENGFKVMGENYISYNQTSAKYYYRVKTNLDVNERHGNSELTLDAMTGKQLSLYIPNNIKTGDIINNWLFTLHMGHLWGLPMQVFICLMGLVITMLSITGVVIWLKKRKAKLIALNNPEAKRKVLT